MTTGPDHTPLVDEQLSAWLDDELPREELELLTTRLAGSSEYQARLARYSLISSSLRSGLRSGLSGGQAGTLSAGLAALQLAGRVRAALDESTGNERQPSSVRPKRLLPYGVAAGLALVAVWFAVVQGPVWRPVAEPVPVAAVGDGVQRSAARRPGTSGQAPISSGRLTSYLVYHGEYSGLLSSRVTRSHVVNNSPSAVALQTADRSSTR